MTATAAARKVLKAGEVQISPGPVLLNGELRVPEKATGNGPVIKMNEDAYTQLRCMKELKIVPGATHLFEEPGKLEEVASLAAKWFLKYLR